MLSYANNDIENKIVSASLDVSSSIENINLKSNISIDKPKNSKNVEKSNNLVENINIIKQNVSSSIKNNLENVNTNHNKVDIKNYHQNTLRKNSENFNIEKIDYPEKKLGECLNNKFYSQKIWIHKIFSEVKYISFIKDFCISMYHFFNIHIFS